MRRLVDTNVLIRMADVESKLRSTSKDAIIRLLSQGDQLFMSAQVAIEFWAVATRPKNVNGLDLSPVQADAELSDFETLLTLLPEPEDIAARWRALARKHSVSGKQAHDTRLVALMEAHALTNS